MVHKVVFRDDALADLTMLYDYIASDSSPEVAIGYIRRIPRSVHEAGDLSGARPTP